MLKLDALISILRDYLHREGNIEVVVDIDGIHYDSSHKRLRLNDRASKAKRRARAAKADSEAKARNSSPPLS